MVIDKIALALAIIGALNWGGIGLFGFDTVAFLCGGQMAILSRIIYALVGLAERLELKNGRIMWPVRTALSGKPVTPGGAVELCQLLGREESLVRIRKGIAQLGG